MEQYILGGKTGEQSFYTFQGEISRRFYYTPGDYWSEKNAEKQAAEYRDEVIAQRSAIAGRQLTAREAVFGVNRVDTRTAQDKYEAQQRLETFNLAPNVELTEGERDLLRAERLMQDERERGLLKDINDPSLTPGQRAAANARLKLEREQVEAEKRAIAEKHFADPVIADSLKAVDDLEALAKWNDSFTVADLEDLQLVRKALSNPEWASAGKDYAKAYFASFVEKQRAAAAVRNRALDEQEHQIVKARQVANANLPESVRAAQFMLDGAEIVDNGQTV